ncbi:flagellar brake protein [Deefgea sp. CFH1-16]|uniref:flagellar brake protein n=1 Tax=Deefgea sp. CFH1-16 TaxID=2675457 RepID=UPI0015F61979|nr:flagellar brake protein [Deefgea sp. CFH1-16]MBM5574716.1 hypothetical protein [Deefgea sp. CFH1-16]
MQTVNRHTLLHQRNRIKLWLATPHLTPIRLKDPSPYLVHDRDEIFLVLTRLAKKPELVCLYANQQSDVFILSALLQVDQNNLIFDLGRNAELNQRLLSAKTICCVAHINSIHYQFDLIVSALTSINEQAAIDCLFPTQMLSLQRRDFYRLSIPLSTPLSCLIPLQQGGDVEISMSDISLGGVGLLGFVPDIFHSKLAVFCTIAVLSYPK